MRLRFACVVAGYLTAGLLAAPTAAVAEPAPGLGRAWEPRPMGAELYGISAPTPANGQSTYIEGNDGTDLYLEWWLPTAKEDREPPAELPVVAILSPYLVQGDPGEADTMRSVVSRGYAYASFHIRGTGLSGGCQEQFSSNEVDDAARAVEWLGRDAPFSNGRVGTTGRAWAARRARAERRRRPRFQVADRVDVVPRGSVLRGAAHIAARLETLSPAGARTPYGEAMGFRSMQHLDPLVDGRFAQTQAKPAPVGVPIPVRLRFDPASLVVPKGGRLRLTVGGSLAPNTTSPSMPSGMATTVTILHDCAHPTILRFQTVGDEPDLLNVRETGEASGPLSASPVAGSSSDGGGIASTRACKKTKPKKGNRRKRSKRAR